LVVGDLHLGSSYVRVLGKGGKERQCPLWSVTVQKLTVLIANRPSSDCVFLNRCARPITRFGIHALVERYVCKIKITMPSLAAKRVSPSTRFAIRQPPIFFVLVWTSTQSVHGLDTSLSTRPMSTRRSIWR
jgi:hypothetical protein